MPFSRPIARTTFSSRSVFRPELFLGHEIHKLPDGDTDFAYAAKRLSSAARLVVKKTATSRAEAERVDWVTPSGSAPSVVAKLAGASKRPRREPGLMPSFWGRGVPEYPAMGRG